MSRYLRIFNTIEPAEVVFQNIANYLQNEGYSYMLYHNEQVFKKGLGIMTGPSFFKITAEKNTLKLESWIKYAILPGVYAGELGITGAMGFAAKAMVKARAEYIQNFIVRTVPTVAIDKYNPNKQLEAQVQPQYNVGGYPQPQAQPQYNVGGYPQPQAQPQYNPGGYAQPQAQPQYNVGGYAQPQVQPQYNPGGYAQPQAQPQYNVGGYAQPQAQPPQATGAPQNRFAPPKNLM